MLSLSEVSLTLCQISMSGEGWRKKLTPKTQNQFIVESFRLAVLDRLVQGKFLTAQMWACYINKSHPLSDASFVDAAMLHNSVSTNNKIKKFTHNLQLTNQSRFVDILLLQRITKMIKHHFSLQMNFFFMVSSLFCEQ